MVANWTRPRSKTSIDIEKLLHWAYIDELSKRITSSNEAVWLKLDDWRNLTPYDLGTSSPQRYDLGEPDEDALTIERAVGRLGDFDFDSGASPADVLGDLSALVTLLPTKNAPVTQGHLRTTARWTNRAGRQVSVELEAPRQVMLVHSLRTSALVIQHASARSRPDWGQVQPRAYHVPADRGPGYKIFGQCKGRNRYTAGSYCPLRWEPSPIAIAQLRADWLAWHHGLELLAGELELKRWAPLPPAVPQMPWRFNSLAF